MPLIEGNRPATFKAMPNQNWLDLAIETTGSVEGVFLACLENGTQIDGAAALQTEFKTPLPIVNREVLDFYIERGVVPATNFENIDLTEKCMYSVCDYAEEGYWE